MGIYFLSEKSTVKAMYSHTKSFLIIRSYTNFYLKTLKEGFHPPFGGSQTVTNSAGSTMSYKESKLKMYCKKLQQKCFIFPIQDYRHLAQRKYTIKKELLFEGSD